MIGLVKWNKLQISSWLLIGSLSPPMSHLASMNIVKSRICSNRINGPVRSWRIFTTHVWEPRIMRRVEIFEKMHSLSSQNHPKRLEMVQQRSSHLRHLKRVESVENLPYQSSIGLTGAMDLLQRQNWAAVVMEGKTTHYNSLIDSLKQWGWREVDGKKAAVSD